MSSGFVAPVYLYDDFILTDAWINGVQAIGNLPGTWNQTGTNQPLCGGVAGAQNGILQMPGNSMVTGNLMVNFSNNNWPVPYKNITKIVFRVVFRMTAVISSGGTVENILGFSHTGTNNADASNAIYGAFLNYFPQWAQGIPDWDTGSNIPLAQLNGFTWGVYGGGPWPTHCGYKPSAAVTTLNTAQWYDVIISLIPGVSCKFYVANYGSTPALDATCTVVSKMPSSTLTPQGPIPVLYCGNTYPGNLLIDKVEYAIWTTEGNKAMGSALAGL